MQETHVHLPIIAKARMGREITEPSVEIPEVISCALDKGVQVWNLP